MTTRHVFLDFDLPCTDPEKMDDFFIPDNVTADTIEEYGAEAPELKKRAAEARLLCYDECPMRARLLCLDEGLKERNTSHGIWGGYTETQRSAVLRELADRQRRSRVDRRQLAIAIIGTEKRESPLDRA